MKEEASSNGPNNEEEALVRAIAEAVTKSDGDLLARSTVLAPVLSYTVIHESGPDRFSGRVFDLILELLNKDEFLQMHGSNHLVHMLELEWDLLSDQQKNILLTSLEAAYGRFHD